MADMVRYDNKISMFWWHLARLNDIGFCCWKSSSVNIVYYIQNTTRSVLNGLNTTHLYEFIGEVILEINVA